MSELVYDVGSSTVRVLSNSSGDVFVTIEGRDDEGDKHAVEVYGSDLAALGAFLTHLDTKRIEGSAR